MRLPRGHVRHVLRAAQRHGVVVVRVAMAKPLEVEGHAQVGQVEEADVVVPGARRL